MTDLVDGLTFNYREHRLPLADSIVYATSLAHDAVVWSMDRDFEGVEGVRYFAPGGGPRREAT